ncbi:hypothetical protein BKA70DRAFT_1115058 [Coprinopsis sp. MPI-PUGE-AT-0042]|nr:hypothetical protein BKA70DRAFT_1115058 [Coprinopsis sp. MPI-PUGE-AT-0042]
MPADRQRKGSLTPPSSPLKPKGGSPIRRSPRGLGASQGDPHYTAIQYARKLQEETDHQCAFLLPELAIPMLERMDFPALISFAMTGSAATALVQEVVMKLIKSVLFLFVKTDEFDTFMELLQSAGGVVAGRAGRRLIQKGSTAHQEAIKHGYDKPEGELQVIVPNGNSEAFIHGLEQLGYKYALPDKANCLFDLRTIHQSKTLTKKDRSGPVSSFTRRMVTEVVLTVVVTTDMNMISWDKVYSWFPGAVYKNEAIPTDVRSRCHSDSMRSMRNEWVDVVGDNRSWKAPCGLECPGVDRCTADDDGIGIFQWRGKGGPAGVEFADRKTDPLLHTDCLLVRVNSRCNNLHCNNWTEPTYFRF